MKLVILGFQQKKLIENNLIAEDAIILRTLKDMVASSRMEKEEDYTWIKLDYLISQIPIVGKKRFIQMRLSYYEKIGLIEKKVIHSFRGQKGSFHIIKLLPKLDLLEDYDETDEVQNVHDPDANHAHTPCKPCTYPMHNLHTKDSSLNNSSVKEDIKHNMSFQEVIFEYWCQKAEKEDALIKHNSLSKAMDQALISIKKIYSIEKVKELIDRFCIVYNNPSEKEFRIHKRSLAEFFGQKAYQKKWLICEEFDDEGCKWLVYKQHQYANKVGDRYHDNYGGTNGKREESITRKGREGKTASQRAEELIRGSCPGPVEEIVTDY